MGGKHILLVDDSSSVRQHLGSILKNAHYQVTDAENGVRAIEKLKSGSFDLLLLDLQMPEMSGVEVLRLVKAGAVGKDLPVLCITGVHKDLSTVHTLQKLGADGFIYKETTPEALLFRVKKAIDPKVG